MTYPNEIDETPQSVLSSPNISIRDLGVGHDKFLKELFSKEQPTRKKYTIRLSRWNKFGTIQFNIKFSF